MIKKRLRKVAALFVTLCMISSMLMSPAFAASASDISNHWAKTTIQSWLDQGFIAGYPDGSFKPDNNITRAEFMTLVNRAYGYTETAPITFSDVDQGAWYASEVAKAKAAGYIIGYTDGTVRPNNPISREEAATIIMRIKNLEADIDAANVFTDAANLTWSKGAVGAVANAKIMIGYPDGSFGSQNLIKRGECVVSLDRSIKFEQVPVIPSIPVTPPAPVVTRNDETNTVSGMTTAMEYKLDAAGYVVYDAAGFALLDFTGNKTLLVRVAAEGINPVSANTTLTFTANPVTPGPVIPAVVAVSTITVTGAGDALTITTDDGNLQMLAAIQPTTATNKAVTWSVINGTGTATISAVGLLTAVTNGTVTVKATSVSTGTVNGTAVITISNQEIPVQSVNIESKVSGAIMPTSMVKVEKDGSFVDTYTLYFDGSALVSTTDGVVTIPTVVLRDLARIEIEIDGVKHAVGSNNPWSGE